MNKRSVVIVLSDLFDDVDSLMAGLKHFRHRRHDVIVFHVLDPQEIEFSFARPTMFQGLEQMPHVVADPRSLRRAYLREFEEYLRTRAQRLPPPRVGLPGDAHRSTVRRGADQLPVVAGGPDARIVSDIMCRRPWLPMLLAFWPFASGWMLLWGLAAAIPILIHFLSRRRYDEVPWAAMDFLLAAIRKHARRWRLEQLLLLVVRTAILLLLALALADPVLSLFGAAPSLAGSGGRHARRAGDRCLVFDGLSTGGCHAV